MTRLQALKQFKREVAPSVVARYGKNDKPACREAWNNWTDMLHKDGKITRQQYDTWIGPKSCAVKTRKGRREFGGPSQKQMYYRAVHQASGADQTFLHLVKSGLTRDELKKLIKRRPSLWGRYASWVSRLPVR